MLMHYTHTLWFACVIVFLGISVDRFSVSFSFSKDKSVKKGEHREQAHTDERGKTTCTNQPLVLRSYRRMGRNRRNRETKQQQSITTTIQPKTGKEMHFCVVKDGII